MFEIVTLDREMCLIVNEEGLLMGLDQNVWASMVASRLIVGDVIYMKRNEIR